MARIFMREQTPEPLLLGPFFSNSSFHLELPIVPKRKYFLEASATLNQGSWVALGSIVGDGNWQRVQEPSLDAAHRFFRIRVEK